VTEPPTPPPAPPAAPPPATPPGAPPSGDPPETPPPSREEVIQNPQALIDALGATRDENRRMTRRIRDFERAERERTEASRTELERATDRATTAETAATASARELMCVRVAMRQLFGGDSRVDQALSVATRLQGASEEEIAKDPLLGLLLGQPAPPTPPGTPPPAGGSRLGDGAPSAGSDAAFNAILRRAAGRG
jgi:hypothetical protein